MDTQDIIKDIFLIELYERKTRKVCIVNQEQVCKHCEYLVTTDINAVYIDSCFDCESHGAFIDSRYSFEKDLIIRYPIILQCLQLCNGKLSVCGTLQEIFGTTEDTPILLLYFHCNVNEAKLLFKQCLELFDDDACFINDTYVYIREGDATFKFYTHVCKSVEELLLNREHVLEKQLWNPKDGYVTTLSTSIAIAFCSYPLDINLPCSQSEYYNSIGFSIILHGLGTINEVLEQQPIESFCLDSAENSYSNIESGEESFEPFANEQINKIYKDGMLQLPDCTFSFRQEELIIHEQKENSPYPYNPLAINTKRLSSKYIGKVNECINQIMAKCNFVEYIPVTRPNFNLQKYLGKNYKPYIVGIDNNRYVAFANSMRQYNLPKEVFRLLCEHWLTSEAMLAEDRLLSLHN